MRSRILSLAILSIAAVAANAQAPSSFIDLGNIVDTQSNYATPDVVSTVSLASADAIQWYRFTYDGTSGTTFFLDIDTTTVGMASAASTPIDTEIGLYDSFGNRIAQDDDDASGLFSALTFGQASPSRSYVIPGGISAMVAANGRDGVLAAGTYWLAVGQFNVTFNASNWNVTSSGTTAPVAFDVNLRTSTPVPEPMTMTVLALGAVAALRRRNRKS